MQNTCAEDVGLAQRNRTVVRKGLGIHRGDRSVGLRFQGQRQVHEYCDSPRAVDGVVGLEFVHDPDASVADSHEKIGRWLTLMDRPQGVEGTELNLRPMLDRGVVTGNSERWPRTKGSRARGGQWARGIGAQRPPEPFVEVCVVKLGGLSEANSEQVGKEWWGGPGSVVVFVEETGSESGALRFRCIEGDQFADGGAEGLEPGDPLGEFGEILVGDLHE